MAVTAAFAIGFMPIDQSAFQGDLVIRGEVIDSFHHQAVPDALVFAISETSVQKTRANSTGHFYFLNLLPGNYRLAAQAYGYVTGCICCRHEPVELDAGFEYDATVWLQNACY